MDAQFAAINATFANMDAKFEQLEHRTIEAMCDMQTELLRGFEAFAAPQNLRLRKVEADQSNLDVALSGRIEVLEKRLYQIEMRLFGAH